MNKLFFIIPVLFFFLGGCKWLTPPQKSNVQDEIVVQAKEVQKKGIHFLDHSPWALDFVFLYSSLQPRYGWPELHPQRITSHLEDSLRLDTSPEGQFYFLEFQLFKRLILPDFQINPELTSLARETDSITVPALYCDQIPLDFPAFSARLWNEAKMGGYRATHALLAFLWAENNGCIQRKKWEGLFAKLLQANFEILEQNPTWGDLELEAAALLGAAGESISRAWVEKTIQAQREDGGWGKYPTSQESDSHATILGVWLLSEFIRQN